MIRDSINPRETGSPYSDEPIVISSWTRWSRKGFQLFQTILTQDRSLHDIVREEVSSYRGGSTAFLPVAGVKVILLVLPFVLVNVRPPVEAVELGLNWKLFPGGKAEN